MAGRKYSGTGGAFTPTRSHLWHIHGARRTSREETQPELSASDSGLTRCLVIGEVNFHPHEQDHFQKLRYITSINTMMFPNFTYSLKVINELRKYRFNRPALGIGFCGRFQATRRRPTKPRHAAFWKWERCFCNVPLTRVFDSFGRVDVIFLRLHCRRVRCTVRETETYCGAVDFGTSWTARIR